MLLYGSRNWPNWGSREWKRDKYTHTHEYRKAGVGGTSYGETVKLWKLNMVIKYSWIGRQGYHTQMNKGVGLLHTDKQWGMVTIYSWTRRLVLLMSIGAVPVGFRPAVFRPWTWEGRGGAKVSIFCISYQHLHSKQRKALPSLWTTPRKSFVILTSLRHWCPWHGYTHVNIHIFKYIFTQDWTCSLQPSLVLQQQQQQPNHCEYSLLQVKSGIG